MTKGRKEDNALSPSAAENLPISNLDDFALLGLGLLLRLFWDHLEQFEEQHLVL